MQKYKIIVEYDGSDFAGWQQQSGVVSVQQVLQEAIYKRTGCLVSVMGAGRTDAGVHALGQVAHWDLPVAICAQKQLNDMSRLRESLNYFLHPYKVSILEVEQVPDDFHARYSAKARVYVYRILNRTSYSPVMNGKIWHVRDALDVACMHDAAQILVGKHDFSAFCSAHCQSKTKIKTMSEIRVVELSELSLNLPNIYQQSQLFPNKIIEIWLRAPSFLHNQVRIIVGNLRKIGAHKMNAAKLYEILCSKDRSKGAETAPADGLFLHSILY